MRGAIDAVDAGKIAPEMVAALVRDRRGLQPVAIDVAIYVAEWRLAGAVSIDGPHQHGQPGGRSMWWGWVAQVYPDETTTTLSMAEQPDAAFNLQWRPANDDARHSESMKGAVSVLRRELAEWIGRPVRLFEVFS